MSDLGFWNLAQADPEATALIDPNEVIYSRGQLLAESNQMVHGLRTLGVEPGDTIAVMMPNCKDFLVAYLAC